MSENVVHRVTGGEHPSPNLIFWCPGCEMAHGVSVDRPGSWTWNHDMIRPTISPSVLVRGTQLPTEEEHERIMRNEAVTPRQFVCHSFVRDGQIQFLGDCTHALANQTVSLRPF